MEKSVAPFLGLFKRFIGTFEVVEKHCFKRFNNFGMGGT
jgi:hypothetical protein